MVMPRSTVVPDPATSLSCSGYDYNWVSNATGAASGSWSLGFDFSQCGGIATPQYTYARFGYSSLPDATYPLTNWLMYRQTCGAHVEGGYIASLANGAAGSARTFTPGGSACAVGAIIHVEVGYERSVNSPSVYDGATTMMTADYRNIGTQANPTPPPPNPLPINPELPGENGGGGNHNKYCPCPQGQSGQPVNTGTGEFWHTFSDLGVQGRGSGLGFSRTYSTLGASVSGLFGFGWTSNYEARLELDANANAIIHQANGSIIAFTNSDLSGTYVPARPRVLGRLIRDGAGNFWFTEHGRTVYEFNRSGQLVAIKDLNGNTTSLSYTAGVLSAVTDAQNRSLTVTTANGVITRITDPAGRHSDYTYDSNGNLSSAADPTGATWTFTYSPTHLMLTMLDPNQQGAAQPQALTNTYDGQGRVVSQTDWAGRMTLFDYITTPGSTIITDPRGNKSVDVYSNGLRTQQIRGYGTPAQATWTYGYDPQTSANTTVTNPNNHTTTYAYDSAGNTTSVTDPLNRTTSRTFDSLNDLLTTTDPAQVTVSNTYDSNGNLLSTTRPLASGVSATTSYTHGDTAHPEDVTAITDPMGKVWTQTHDAYGDLTSTTDPLGHQTTMTYNPISWLMSTVTARGNASGGTPARFTTTLTRDSDGRVLTSTGPLQHVTTSVYDRNGNLSDVTDPAGRHTHTDYNADNQPVLVTRPDNTTLGSGYDPAGNLTSQTDGAGRATTYSYDPLNHLATVTDPLNRTTRFTSSGVGELLTVTKPDGVTATRTYDAASELTGITFSDSTPAVSGFGYDPVGRLIARTDGTGTSAWSYDLAGRLTSTTNGAGSTTSYTYDKAGHQSTLTYPDGQVVTRTFDDAGRTTKINDGLGHDQLFGYNEANNLTSSNTPNGVASSVNVDDTGLPLGITHTENASTIATFGYTRNPDGQLTSAVAGADLPAQNDTYGYTPLGQVQTVRSAAYHYDSADNPTGLIDGTGQTFDVANQLTASTHITTVGSSTAGDAGGTPNVTVTLPAGIQAGDQILLSSVQAGNDLPATPTGYVFVTEPRSGSGPANASTAVFRRTATGGETSATISYPLVTGRSITVVVYRGVDGVAPIDAVQINTWHGTGLTLPSLTPSGAGDELVTMLGAEGNATPAAWTPPSGMTNEADKSDLPLTSGQTDDQSLLDASPTGPRGALYPNAVDVAGAILLLRPSQTTYGYDTNGNRTRVSPTTGSPTAMAYDAENRLTGYGSAATYRYDASGLRTSKTVNGVTQAFSWDPSASLPQLLTDGPTNYVYGPDGLPIEQATKLQIALVDTGHAEDPGTANSTTLTLGHPAVPGDLIMVSTTTSPGQTVSVSGFTTTFDSQNAASHIQLWIKFAAGGEQAITISTSGVPPHPRAYTAVVYRNVDRNTPIDTIATASGSPLVLPSRTTTLPNDQLVTFGGVADNTTPATLTPPGGMTSRSQVNDLPLVAADISDQTLSQTGPTGTRTYTVSDSNTHTAIAGTPAGLILTLRPTPPLVLYYHHDQLGSTTMITDQAGTIRTRYTYDAYGRTTTIAGFSSTPLPVATPLQYTGQYTDVESSLLYLRARYYDPATAHFLTRDPLEALTRSAYGYAGSSPLNASDPSGLMVDPRPTRSEPQFVPADCAFNPTPGGSAGPGASWPGFAIDAAGGYAEGLGTRATHLVVCRAIS